MTAQEEMSFDHLLLQKYEESLRNKQAVRRKLFTAEAELREAEEEVSLLNLQITYAEKTYFPRLESEYARTLAESQTAIEL